MFADVMNADQSLLDLMKSVGWTAPSLARDLHVHVTELAAVLEAWPFPLSLPPVPQPADAPVAFLHEA